jgi:hypothetical protein
MSYNANYENAVNEFWRLRCAAAADMLKKNGFKAECVATADEAKQKIKALIPKGASVGRTGSMTISNMGIYEELAAEGYAILDPYAAEISPDESVELRKKVMTADVLLASSNAVTMDGKLVNVDGTGNRVAGMIFGPKKVIIAVGKNKIVDDVEGALQRIKNVAAPMNALRLNAKTPCTKTGRCTDCSSTERICNVTVIIDRCPSKTQIHVIIIREDAGF